MGRITTFKVNGYQVSKNYEERIRERGKKHHSLQKFAPRALVVDDDPLASNLLQMVLLNFGFEVSLSFDGADSLDKFIECPYDLVFLDINMPVLTGTEVLSKIEEIRLKNLKDCKKWQLLPIVTISAFPSESVMIPEERGFYIVGHWQKPICISELTSLVSRTVAQLGIPISTKRIPKFEISHP